MLEGRLTKNGRVYGNYESQDLHDDGSGGFFLETKPGKRLEGFWAGYDSANNSVTAGKYKFWPLEKIPAAALGPNELDQALSVLGSELGYKYVSREELASYSQDTDKIALISKDAQGVIGAVTGRIFETVDAFLASLPQDMTNPLRECLPGLDFNKIGFIKSVAVDRSMQGRGIASGLVDAATSKLWSLGATLIVSIGWTDEEGCHIQGVFDAAHFSTKGDIPDFWLQDSLDKGYSCPTCGTPCRCVARIFSKHRRDSAAVAETEPTNMSA
ncbi:MULTISPECIES: GNAT family N-acetyltransferase [unclassified Arthrobacter]|uniref:GNAT family N-acetyltransferase n=1 Tax=unclassified Arthrobacter TaxID=235627 RepID=UPI001E31F3B3|nr:MULTISPECIES: GNAT family N-acetyltransferase [unclassified Arthrobacter]MCC9144457.1 GNAT family N-acetyltransferase [Arthrobacter sp. zg-Y919]MDK1275683.1 GNAT family N-acetyltransferase [Arthrobacter sp. zg.Y919]WIB02949.1 GNAT family N-acetyltransferase [Arthrobacter sp. zg-Y919]